MAAIMIGIEILKPVKVNLFQDTRKLKKISQKESLKDYRKDVSIWVTGMQRCAANLQILVRPFVIHSVSFNFQELN